MPRTLYRVYRDCPPSSFSCSQKAIRNQNNLLQIQNQAPKENQKIMSGKDGTISYTVIITKINEFWSSAQVRNMVNYLFLLNIICKINFYSVGSNLSPSFASILGSVVYSISPIGSLCGSKGPCLRM